MAEYDNTNRGSIWKNDRKEKDTHPDFRGSLNVNGVEYWFDAWKRKEGQSERAPALSFKIKPKEEVAQTEHQQAKQDGYKPDSAFDDDDIKF